MALASLSENLRMKSESPVARFMHGTDKVTQLLPLRPGEKELPAQGFESDWRIPVTAGDLRDVVRLLRKYPDGLLMGDPQDPFRKRILDPGKLVVYRDLQLIMQTGSRLWLAPSGHELAAGLAPEAGHFRALLYQRAPYRAALEWLQRQALERATDKDLIEFWSNRGGPQRRADGNGEGVDESRIQQTLKARAVSFFHLCQAADFGLLTLGKRGQPARLRIDQEELGNHLKQGKQHEFPPAVTANTETMKRAGKLRVAISAGSHSTLIQQTQTALSLADIESEVIVREPGLQFCLGETASENWRRCGAGIIIVSATDQTDGALKESVLMSLGAAAALYANRFALLWEKPLPVPAGLMNLRRCEFEGEGLTWELGAKLVQAVKEFKL